MEEDDELPGITPKKGLYIALISVHGRIRGHDLELGLESDTGGQTLYVVELARALGRHPEVQKVDLFTRRIVDDSVDDDYAQPIEELDDGVRIVRIDAGPPEYIRKELLWDHLDSFADNMLDFLRRQESLPDVVHGHYADAGYVGTRLDHILGCPLVYTGHSLGRVKRRRLLAGGAKQQELEEKYFISRRIEAEEVTLTEAVRVVTSTRQEVEEQYALYDQYQPDRMRVIPPGLDLGRFHPDGDPAETAEIEANLARWLRDPELPIVLAIARPDARKNLPILIRTFGESEALRKAANLVIVAGNRDDVRLEEQSYEGVLTNLLLAIDAYDVHGSVAMPKRHRRDEVPLYYRLAARRKGVFINPALTEPFGLTLLEAAASGLPIVATEDGGPTEILSKCGNGVLIDPLDSDAISAAILSIIGDRERWEQLSKSGVKGVQRHYSWSSHARDYVEVLKELPSAAPPYIDLRSIDLKQLYNDRAIFTDIDQNLLGEPTAIERFSAVLRKNRTKVAFGIATGRTLKRAIQFLREHHLPPPDVLITSLGANIHYAPRLTVDRAWREHVDHLWNPVAIRRILREIPGLELQPMADQDPFKISYTVDPEVAPSHEELVSTLRSQDQTVNVSLSFGTSLDVVPVRVSKGSAIRYVADQWGIPLERVLAAGGSGADEDMMRGNTLAVVVANRHKEELSQLVDLERIYFSKQPYADGILEAIDYYDFFGRCEVPPECDEAPSSPPTSTAL